MLLADFVQAVQGKLYVLGGGWSVTGPGAVQMGIAVKIEGPPGSFAGGAAFSRPSGPTVGSLNSNWIS